MKANELMIGDWVYLPSIMSDDKYPVQVLEIQDDCIKYYVGNKKMMVRFKYVEHIPLTPEILEKNGFVKSPHYPMVFRIIEDNFRVAINMDGGLYLSIIKTFDDGSEEFNYHTPQPKSVHELQHALRLCGITLNIEV